MCNFVADYFTDFIQNTIFWQLPIHDLMNYWLRNKKNDRIDQRPIMLVPDFIYISILLNRRNYTFSMEFETLSLLVFLIWKNVLYFPQTLTYLGYWVKYNIGIKRRSWLILSISVLKNSMRPQDYLTKDLEGD